MSTVLPADFVLKTNAAPAAEPAPAPAPVAVPPVMDVTLAPNTAPAAITRSAGFIERNWKYLTAVVIVYLVVYYGYTAVKAANQRVPFKITKSLTHAGPWYRRAALAPYDMSFPDRTWEVKADWLGRKYVIHHVGPRVFVQLQSDQPAVEVLMANSK